MKPQNKSTQQNKMDIDKEESSEESEDEKPQAQSKKVKPFFPLSQELFLIDTLFLIFLRFRHR